MRLRGGGVALLGAGPRPGSRGHRPGVRSPQWSALGTGGREGPPERCDGVRRGLSQCGGPDHDLSMRPSPFSQRKKSSLRERNQEVLSQKPGPEGRKVMRALLRRPSVGSFSRGRTRAGRILGARCALATEPGGWRVCLLPGPVTSLGPSPRVAWLCYFSQRSSVFGHFCSKALEVCCSSCFQPQNMVLCLPVESAVGV